MVEERRALWTALEATRGERGEARDLEVTLIRPGTSNNGLRYGERVLAESVELWNGAASFCDHPGPLDQGRAGGRSVRDLVGVFADARHEPGRGIVARLRLYPNAEWLARMVEAHLEDIEAGRPTARLGISADMLVVKELAEEAGSGRRIHEVRRIIAVNSADVVMNPSAGGQFERILEGGEGEQVESEETRAAEGTDLAATENVTALRAELARERIEARLARSGLSEQAQRYVRTQLCEGIVEASEVDRAIEGVKGLLATAAPSPVRGMGTTRAAVISTPRERVQVALDRLFGIEPPAHLSDVPRLTGIREAYIAITGDRLFDGRYHFESSVLEADEVTMSVMADALGDSMTKRLVKEYQGQRRWWEPISVKVPLGNMLAQNRIQVADFASLPTVAENGPYVNLAWSDTKESYTPVKKGSAVYVTMEMIINDDLRTVARIPKLLANAANITINEVVSALFTVNSGTGPHMTDAEHVFAAARNNHGTTALASASLQTAMVAMSKQTNAASHVLGLKGRYLLVPPDLQYTAAVITGTDRDVGTAYNNINPLYGQITPIVVPQFTDANDWYLMADPSEIECIEVGFLNGRQEPELLVQDSPVMGTVFTNDAITYKVRHIYGAGWIDFRGAFGMIVA